MIKLKRAYQPAAGSDGYRVLVERLWPRGIRKQALPLDGWMKEIAPSTELRKWFGHAPERWTGFQQRYLEELKSGPAAERLRELAARASKGTVTLVYSSRDAQHNNAVVLKHVLERLTGRARARSRDEQPGA